MRRIFTFPGAKRVKPSFRTTFISIEVSKWNTKINSFSCQSNIFAWLSLLKRQLNFSQALGYISFIVVWSGQSAITRLLSQPQPIHRLYLPLFHSVAFVSNNYLYRLKLSKLKAVVYQIIASSHKLVPQFQSKQLLKAYHLWICWLKNNGVSD